MTFVRVSRGASSRGDSDFGTVRYVDMAIVPNPVFSDRYRWLSCSVAPDMTFVRVSRGASSRGDSDFGTVRYVDMAIVPNHLAG